MPPRTHSELLIHGWRASIFGPARLLGELEELFPANRSAPDAAAATATFEVQLDTPRPGWQRIMRDGTPLWVGQDAEELLAYLEWGINRTAAEWLGQTHLLFHAGSAVACDARGLILPAASGSGKTTLVAGLVAAGCRYLSDEVAVIEPHHLSLLPFAKSLCVKAGGRDVLVSLYPSLATGFPRRRFGGEPVWYLPPAQTPRLGLAVSVRYVVLPTYQPGCVTALRAVRRSAALQRLLEQSFNLRAHGAWGVGRLVDVMRGAECYALSVGSLPAAVDVLSRLASDG